HVHCYFAEPTHSPSMLIGLMTGLHDQVSVQDFGIDNMTAADGLAVGRPSGFVGRVVQPILNGVYTVTDERMKEMLRWVYETE
ncbi:pyridoxal-phosphate dependent enzyme, partial [Staphylococcus pasteuri_A]